MTKNKRVGLVIPYFEAGVELLHTLDSVVLNADDLILIVDDGSINLPARNFVPKAVGKTPVLLIELQQNLGITGALLSGISSIPQGYEFIARLDCGDYCSEKRFEIQRSFLEDNLDVVLVGAWVDFVSPSREKLYSFEPPKEHIELQNYMKINCPIIHPTAMFRRSAYDAVGGYRDSYPSAEDFDLFLRLSKVGSISNIAQTLVYCSTNDGGISTKRRKEQIQSRIKILASNFDWSPLAFYGLVRSVLLWLIPRSWSSVLSNYKQDMRARVNNLKMLK